MHVLSDFVSKIKTAFDKNKLCLLMTHDAFCPNIVLMVESTEMRMKHTALNMDARVQRNIEANTTWMHVATKLSIHLNNAKKKDKNM
ncbi:hypothetical protein XELAEV_18015685mg [Xenopus laevis]|uniref:Uncharacterized protein n=1 Tax=Xenopus laevis TaxID=8355 RepID=A0A974HWE7_XENLA|nr:hypothetical protein XELAEV_18015685mg [Xenopus laevis]